MNVKRLLGSAPVTTGILTARVLLSLGIPENAANKARAQFYIQTATRRGEIVEIHPGIFTKAKN